MVLNGVGLQNATQNRFEMQGKESEKTFGLNRINFGARTYNPTSVVWDRIDLMAGKHYNFTPYNYVLNSPLKYIDPYGLDTLSSKDSNFNWDKVRGGDIVDGTYVLDEAKVIGIKNTYGPENGYESGTLVDFISRYKLKSISNVQHELDQNRNIGKFSSQAGGPALRFIEHPKKKGKFIDMRHFTIVGYDYRTLLGAALEFLQLFKYPKSAMNPQDFWSNALGENFRTLYGGMLQKNPENFTEYLNDYLNNTASNRAVVNSYYKEIIKNFKETSNGDN